MNRPQWTIIETQKFIPLINKHTTVQQNRFKVDWNKVATELGTRNPKQCFVKSVNMNHKKRRILGSGDLTKTQKQKIIDLSCDETFFVSDSGKKERASQELPFVIVKF